MQKTEPQKKIDFALGGQAVMEGVMIRSPSFVTVAVRKRDGEIAIKKDPFLSLTQRIKILKLPILRGVVNLFEMIVVGMKALDYSVQTAFEEPKEKPAEQSHAAWGKFLSGLSLAFSVVASLALALFLFKFIPLFLTEQLARFFPILKKSGLLFNLIDGLFRISIFFLYIAILAKIKYFQRIFEYHGAEHMAVFAYEKGKTLTPEHVKEESPRHPRCGTSFIIVVLLISILLFSFVPRHPEFLLNFLRRLAVVPLIAGVGYEILKWSAKYQNHGLVKLITYPGIFTQYLTTRQPDEKQIEVAIAALEGAIQLERDSKKDAKKAITEI